METLLTTVLSSALFLTTSFSTPITSEPHMIFTRVLPEKNFVGHVVVKDESLAAIALSTYGSEDYWTTLWNDNAWIADPEAVAKGAVIKVRMHTPEEPLVLASVLEERNNALLKQKNDAYLEQLSYLSAETAETVQPTVVPTQAIPVKAPSVAGTLSEEAIAYLGSCEAGMDPAKNTGNGYYGAFQFSYGTWKNLNTGYERADLAPLEVQKAAVQQLLQKSSIYNQFPACANKMRNAGLI